MAQLYDARGNRYLVVSPAELAQNGVALPSTPQAAAAQVAEWAKAAIKAFARHKPGAGQSKPFISDGLLIGPFSAAAPFPLLILNTDGSLAERSGNGLTIFATALRDQGLAPAGAYDLAVHFGGAAALLTQVTPGERLGAAGIWVGMGEPDYGPQAVAARPEASHAVPLPSGIEGSHVPALAALNPVWRQSQFVRVGNPHCVTLLDSADALPSWEALHEPALFQGLRHIADAAPSGGVVCPAGINLQWAASLGGNRVAARIFERGEGPTPSSGTSAVAVAAAALRHGWVQGPLVEIVMPGGTAPVMAERRGSNWQLSLFGEAVAVVD